MQEFSNTSQSALQYQGRYYPLNKAQIIIGSDRRCDVCIENNPHILPVHAQLTYRAGRAFIRYMGRDAAIWVNGVAVSQQALQHQDEIALGDRDTKLTILLDQAPAQINQQEMLINGTQDAHYAGRAQSSAMQRINRVDAPSGEQPFPPIATTPYASTIGTSERQPEQFATTPQQQAQTSTPAISSTGQETTRYLCAAGHLDENIQDYVLRNVIYEEHKALGESYGVDMLTVVSWCKAGINRITIRDRILTGLLGLLVVAYIWTTLSLLGGLIRGAAATTSSGLSGVGLLLSFVASLLAFVPITIVLIVGYYVEKWIKRRWPRSFPGVVTYFVILAACVGLLAANVLLGLLIFVLVWLTIFGELVVRFNGKSIKRLSKDTFNPQLRPALLDPYVEQKLQESFVTGQRNVVAYSGTRPFAGGGIYKDGWSFVIDTSKGAYDNSNFTAKPVLKNPIPFKVGSLYDAVKRDMQEIGIKNVLEIEEKLYVRGQYISEHPRFFNAQTLRPMTSVEPALVEHYKEHPIEDIRYYQCLRFNFWRGEMVFTVFLRFVQQGKDLFTEVNYLLLPPMNPDYYWIDERELTSFVGALWMPYKRSFNSPLQLWLGAPRRLLRDYSYARQQRRQTRMAQSRPAFDYGAKTSLRQYASDNKYHLFFQEIDQQMYLKVVEKQILETVCNFLEKHQIDTDEFMRRQQTILNNNTTNNNTINNNGTFNNAGTIGNVSGGRENNKA